jgi:hypothetical protein
MGCDGMRRDARTCAVRWGWGGFYAGRRQACIRGVYLNEQGRAGQGRQGKVDLCSRGTSGEMQVFKERLATGTK